MTSSVLSHWIISITFPEITGEKIPNPKFVLEITEFLKRFIFFIVQYWELNAGFFETSAATGVNGEDVNEEHELGATVTEA